MSISTMTQPECRALPAKRSLASPMPAPIYIQLLIIIITIITTTALLMLLGEKKPDKEVFPYPPGYRTQTFTQKWETIRPTKTDFYSARLATK